MKVRIKKTGQILNVEYDDDDLYKGWDGSGPVWFTYNEFDFVDEEADDSQPHFTLTPEEVEIVQNIVAKEYLDMQYLIKTYKNDKLYVNIMRDKVTILDNLLDRINEWQDEQNTTRP